MHSKAHLLLEEIQVKGIRKEKPDDPKKKSVSGTMKMEAWSIAAWNMTTIREKVVLWWKTKRASLSSSTQVEVLWEKVLAVVAVAVEAKFAFFPISSNREVLPNKWHF